MIPPPGEPLGYPEPWPAPAKLNLCLHIVGRRADGYHLLQTAFQFVDLTDTVQFYRRPAGVIERVAGPADVPPHEDLAMRAARALGEGRNLPGVAIAIDKRIPLGGGLGGGSSDAATVLVALNRLWRLRLATPELAAIGLRLGADVPIFVSGRAAWAEGVGERLTFCDWPEKPYLLVYPGTPVTTHSVFQAPELTRNSTVTTIRDFLARGGHNDCTSVVRALYREVSEALDFLGQFGEPKLTGTGACVFLPVSDERAAERIGAQLPQHWHSWFVRGSNASPLFARLAQEGE